MALLALALRYRTTAERGFYKALAELHKLRAVIRENLIRQRTEEEREYKAALDYLCYAPIGAPLPHSSFRRTSQRVQRKVIRSRAPAQGSGFVAVT
jgi:hypothetical protein